MGNVLSREKRQQVIALGRLEWTLRRIEEATGVRRETASGYLKAAGIEVRRPGRWGHPPPANPAIETSTDPPTSTEPGPEAKPAIEVSTDSAVSAEAAKSKAVSPSLCRFRGKPNTHSDRSRTLIPTEAEHPFRAKANT